MHMSFIVKSYLLRALNVGAASWCRVIQHILVLALLTCTGCRVGESMLTKDYNEDTCMKWSNVKLTFPGGRPDLSKAVLRLRVQYLKGFKGGRNVSRDITSAQLNIPGRAHLCMPKLVLLYAMRFTILAFRAL